MKLIRFLVQNFSYRLQFNRFTSTNNKVKSAENPKTNLCSYRTNNCGQLTVANVGQTVKLAGWLEYQRLNKFLVLRDSYGHVQLILKDQKFDEILKDLTLESVIEVEGVVRKRPDAMINKEMTCGHIEIAIDRLQVLNRAKNNLPFNIRGFQKPNEQLRMKYRYLDLRFAEVQHNLKFRSHLLHKFRKFLIEECDFLDVETPVLFRPTPGGAKEFLVESPIADHYYALVQSPQQFKQILMSGSIDKYFQIAKCFRNETARSDRQIEFSQLDLEMAFANIDDVRQVVERLIRYAWSELVGDRNFKRLTYSDAMEWYGTDKPDLRFENRIENCDEIFEQFTVNGFRNVRALVFQNHLNVQLTTKLRNEIAQMAKTQFPTVKLIQTKLTDSWAMKITKLWPQQITDAVIDRLKLASNDLFFLAYGPQRIDVLKLLGRIRLLITSSLPIDNQRMEFVWIDEFPMFELIKGTQQLQAVHHPFTMLNTADEPQFFSANRTIDDLLRIRGQSYDLILNGNEIGGGSVRIHDVNYQKEVLKCLKIDFGQLEHLMDALAAGCPPHAGFAMGIDRFLAVALHTNSIRDIIAFPKSIEGRDLMANAPIAIY